MLLGAEVEGGAGKHAGAHGLVGVGQAQLDGEGVGGGVDGRIDQRHLGVVFLAGQGVETDDGAVALLHAAEILLADVDEQLHGTYLLDGEHGAAGVEVAVVVVAGRHDARDGAQQRGVLLQIGVAGLVDVERHLGVVVLGLAGAANLVELLDALEVGLLVGNLELKLTQRRGVHLHQLLALDDVVAHLDEDAADAPGCLRGDVVLHFGLDGAGVVAHLVDGPLVDGCQAHLGLGALLLHGSLGGLLSARAAAHHGGHGEGYKDSTLSHVVCHFCLFNLNLQSSST